MQQRDFSIPGAPSPRRRRARRLAHAAGLVALIVLLVSAALYGRLMIGPLSLGFLSAPAERLAESVLPPSLAVDLGQTVLSLDGATPVLRFEPVTLTDRQSGGQVAMGGLEIGFSPLSAVWGRPGAFVTLDRPRLQLVQDLDGARLAQFDVVDAADGGPAEVRVTQAGAVERQVRIGEDGLIFASAEAVTRVRSDNDWLIANVETLDRALAQFSREAAAGSLARIRLRGGEVDMHDPVFGTLRTLRAIEADIWVRRSSGEVAVESRFEIGGRTTEISLARDPSADGARLTAQMDNLDLATLVPFLDNADAMMALKGAGTLEMAFDFDPESGAVTGGRFGLDLTGSHLRLQNDLYPIAMRPLEVSWHPEQSRFSFSGGSLAVGGSRAVIAGDVVMGLDPRFGPVVGLSIRARDLFIEPYDLEPAQTPFDHMVFEGWSSPLYGALGIDRLGLVREGVAIAMSGRIDSMDEGPGIALSVRGTGASADDIQRIWPYVFSPEARQTVIDYLDDGRLVEGTMRFDFPVGTIAPDGAPRPVPEGGIEIALVGEGIELAALEGLPPFAISGQTRVEVNDNQMQIGFERAEIDDPAGAITVENGTLFMQDMAAARQIIEISGDVVGAVPTLLRAADSHAPDLLAGFDIGYDLPTLADSLAGMARATVIGTIENDDTGRTIRTDYALNGSVTGLETTAPIDGFSVADGNFSFTASQEGYRVTGGARVQDVPLSLQAAQAGQADPDIVVSATLDAAEAERFGVDLSEFLTGSVALEARPQADGAIALAADLTRTGMALPDIGIAKPAGQAGTLDAVLAMGSDTITVEDLALRFGDVRLEGGLEFSPEGELRAADFSTFRISPGDDARVALAPRADGFAVSVQGSQLDIKPILGRFFDLEGSAPGGASAELEDQVFTVDVDLDRALGHYGTTAYNVDLALTVRGDEIRQASAAAQLGGNGSLAVTTNGPATNRTITYASNDLGTLMRFIGIYPRLVGGSGTLVVNSGAPGSPQRGEFVVSNFSILGEENLAQVIGTHADSRAIASTGQISFDQARGSFIQNGDVIVVEDAALYGETVGGTLRGNIFTTAGQYDLVGTYVPLFGLNNFFQQIPVLGPIFGGREGEGLLGVTFAVRGPLDAPDLLVNPVSILAPGVFRSLFEFRSAQGG